MYLDVSSQEYSPIRTCGNIHLQHIQIHIHKAGIFFEAFHIQNFSIHAHNIEVVMDSTCRRQHCPLFREAKSKGSNKKLSDVEFRM